MSYQDLLTRQQTHFFSVVRPAPVSVRKEKLKKLRSWIMTHRKDIQQAVFLDFRKGAEDADLSEIKPLLAEIDHTLRHLKDWTRYRAVGTPLYLLGSRSGIQRDPKGVALIISPWNFPFMLAVNPLISAVSAGCCAVIKPSELAPNTSRLLEKMAGECFPPEEVSVVQGDASVSESLLKLKWDHIFFTGSPQIGKLVMTAAAANLTSVTLELGGENPAIVDETANLRDTAEKLIWGKFMNNGQSCVSVNTVFVQETVKHQFEQELIRALTKLYPDLATRISGPEWIRVIAEKHTQRIARLIYSATEAGARELAGGGISVTDRVIPPTILTDIPPDHPIVSEELFGPVLPVVTFRNIEEVFHRMRTADCPLMAYLFTRSRTNLDRFLLETRSGGVAVNETTLPFVHPGLPFGGTGKSGLGKAHGVAGFLAFTNEKPVFIQRRGLTTMKLVYPPFNPVKKLIIDILLKWL